MTAADLARLDVPAVQVAADAKALADKRLTAGCLAEQAHQLDASDGAFARLACEHGDCCSTDNDYPEWAAQLAARTNTGGNR